MCIRDRYDSGRNTGLTKLDEFHKNQAKIEQEKYWTRMFWNWILPALLIALWLLSLLGRKPVSYTHLDVYKRQAGKSNHEMLGVKFNA